MRTARTIADGVGYYHVILKATGPQFLFREDADKAAFQDILGRVSRFSSVQPLAYAFLDNHMHLLLKVPERRSVPDDPAGTDLAVHVGQGAGTHMGAADVGPPGVRIGKLDEREREEPQKSVTGAGGARQPPKPRDAGKGAPGAEEATGGLAVA